MIDAITSFFVDWFGKLVELAQSLFTAFVSFVQSIFEWAIEEILKPIYYYGNERLADIMLQALTSENLPFIPSGVHVLNSFVEVQDVLQALIGSTQLVLSSMALRFTLRLVRG